ncbi:hypothetical protein BDF19DRAFT_322514 [Syncephalis fuscata]|nr:hypothetical protein BDF19DRAFT_322514 [Syncephalis fuscata]
MRCLSIYANHCVDGCCTYHYNNDLVQSFDYTQASIILQVYGDIIDDAGLMSMMTHLLNSPLSTSMTQLMGHLFGLLASRSNTMMMVKEHAESLLTLWRQSSSEALDEVLLVVVAATSPLLFASASTLVYQRSITACPVIFTSEASAIPFKLKDEDVERLLIQATPNRLELLALASTLDQHVRHEVTRLINMNRLPATLPLSTWLTFIAQYTQLFCTWGLAEESLDSTEAIWHPHTKDEDIKSVYLLMNGVLNTLLSTTTNNNDNSNNEQALSLLKQWWSFTSVEYRQERLIQLQQRLNGLSQSSSSSLIITVIELVQQLLEYKDESLYSLYTAITTRCFNTIINMNTLPTSIYSILGKSLYFLLY